MTAFLPADRDGAHESVGTDAEPKPDETHPHRQEPAVLDATHRLI
jgi:hypothetical protein